jgi:hypothetical protein
MIDKPKMVQHDPAIPPFTHYVHLNNLQQFLPFVFQVILGNIFLPNNSLELWLKVRSKFNIFNGSGLKPPLTLSWHFSSCSNTCLIYLHFQRTQFYFDTIKTLGKRLCNSLMIPVQIFTKPVVACILEHLTNLYMRFQIGNILQLPPEQFSSSSHLQKTC